jgi:Uncharacterised protein conserved in bacteria (DUF2336)
VAVKLDRLIELSKDRTAVGRRELLHAVTDLYLVDSDPNERAKNHYADIAGRAIEQIDEGDRVEYAERVAPEGTLPHPVANQLANNPDPSVAAVVLQRSPVLTDDDLTAVALNHSAGHMIAIAGRATLSENVTEVLVRHGNREVLLTVSQNDGARFSHDGVSGLLDRAVGDKQILASLARRKHEFTPQQVHRLQKIAQEAGAGSALRSAKASPQDRRPALERQLEMKQLMMEIRKGNRSASDVVQLLAFQDRVFDLAQMISALAGIPNVQGVRVLLDGDVTGIAAACLAIGVLPDAFKAVIKMRASRLNFGATQIQKEVETYSDLTNEGVERALRQLPGRKA